MNKTELKNYAIWARKTLIEAVVQRAYEYDVTDGGVNDTNQNSVKNEPLSPQELSQRKALISRINLQGFENVMEEVAYTWFNRFIALRYMEVNGYLPSRVRVFTDESGVFRPEILKEALTVEIAGLDRGKIIEMVENQQNEALFKYLLITQCNELNGSIPAVFETIGGWTELLFPANLLREGSVLERMVTEIPEEDWQEQVQIIGWLYQYYNSELKDETFAMLKKNVKISEDRIPAATQLFTPDWIVRYMVENSLGRLWTEGHESFDKSEWKYYLDEAQQEEAVQAELDKIRSEYKNIQPEQIKFIDPCMGSGHILVYAFDVLMEIYTSCGWAEKDAAASILQHNLYGLDIDKRAYQLSYFALMMKARKYSRRILKSGIQPNLSHFQNLSGYDLSLLPSVIKSFAEQFAHADTYGSLLEVTMPDGIDEAIDEFSGVIGFERESLEQMMQIYKILSQKYDVVCTNPPYMGGSGMNARLSDFVKNKYPDSKSDLFAIFIERCGKLAKSFYAMITQHSWMFLSSFEKLRNKLAKKTIVNMAHLGARAFDEISGEVVQTTAFVISAKHVKKYNGCYSRLVNINGENEKAEIFLSGENRYTANQENFSKIPGSPVAYWVSENFIKTFERKKVSSCLESRVGLDTGDNSKFLRLWFEINNKNTCYNAKNYDDFISNKGKYVPHTKGGAYRKWYGNFEYILKFNQHNYNLLSESGNHLPSRQYYFRKGFSWTRISSGAFSVRLSPEGFVFNSACPTVFSDDNYFLYSLGLFNTNVMMYYVELLSPTINYQSGDISKVPFILSEIYKSQVDTLVKENINISKTDWDSFETSWDFKRHPLV